jgi:TolB protein
VGDRKAIPVKGSVAKNVAAKGVRRAVHTFVNGVIEAITGKPGIFGSQILFSLKLPGFQRTILAMDMDGSGRRTVVDNGSANMFPRWAPGGSVLYTSFLSGLPQVYVDDRRITHDEREYRGAAFSPDGSRIVASVDMDGQSDLVLLDPRTGEITKRLTETEWDEVSPSWSPDGRRIAFCSNKTGRPQIYLVNADGTGERRLTMRGSYNTSPRFGPTGLVVFAGMDDFVSDLFTVDMSGNINRLTQQQGSNKDPTWSPDGRWLVFLSDRAGPWRAFLMTEDGRYQFPITSKGEPLGTPDWK